jgi:UMF1 family MFS transporter
MTTGERPGILARLGLGGRAQRAWAMYDWANSAMVTLIVTAVFPIYYSQVPASGLDPVTAKFRFAMATTMALAISAVLSPVLGTITDYTASKLRYLKIFMLLGVLATGLMFFLGPGLWFAALVLFGLANIGANGSFVFYEALLPHVAPADELDRLSTSAYALGYLGGGLLLVFAVLMIQFPGAFGFPAGAGLTPAEASLPARVSFLLTALWWLVFSIPLFRHVPEPPASPRPAGTSVGGAVRTSFVQLGDTLRHLRSYRQAFLLLVAFLIYNDGIGTIIRMATIYGEERQLSQTVMIGAIALVQFIGIPFSVLFGRLAGVIGAKRSIFIGLVVYLGISILAYYMSTAWHFILLACLVGTVQGGTQALSRSLFASMVPRRHSGEFFGFFSVFEKFAGIFGPLFFGVVVATTGSSQQAILSVVVFFLVGGALLWFVDVKEGQARATEEG